MIVHPSLHVCAQEHGLLNPSNRQFVLSDSKLKDLFQVSGVGVVDGKGTQTHLSALLVQVDTFRAFGGIMKLLKPHILS